MLLRLIFVAVIFQACRGNVDDFDFKLKYGFTTINTFDSTVRVQMFNVTDTSVQILGDTAFHFALSTKEKARIQRMFQNIYYLAYPKVYEIDCNPSSGYFQYELFIAKDDETRALSVKVCDGKVSEEAKNLKLAIDTIVGILEKNQSFQKIPEGITNGRAIERGRYKVSTIEQEREFKLRDSVEQSQTKR